MKGEPCSIAGCEKPQHGRGWCAMHLRRWQKTGDPGKAERFSGVDLHGSLEDRFWLGVRKAGPDDCWLWQHAVVKTAGYGVMNFDGQIVLAHRFAWELHNGRSAGALHVLHKCDVRRCCNWRHLFLGTHAANMADMVNKKRHHVGSKRFGAKLDEAKVAAIRSSERPISVLASEYSVSERLVSRVRQRVCWKHVP